MKLFTLIITACNCRIMGLCNGHHACSSITGDIYCIVGLIMDIKYDTVIQITWNTLLLKDDIYSYQL